MPQIYLSLVTNRRGEKIPLFLHQNRLILYHLSQEWLRTRPDRDYWLFGVEIQAVEWATLEPPAQPQLVHG